MPKVSVITPCYNGERFLGETIQSILAQTFHDFELIAVDDGSTDGTRQVVESFDDPRIHYIYQENQGPAAARNTGISAAQGDVIAPLDADDLALPHRLAHQLEFLESHPDLSVVGSGYVWIDENGIELPWPHHAWQRYPELNNIRGWLYDCPFVPSATMFRRAAWQDVGGFDEGLIGPEDWNFWMRLVLQGHRMAWHKEVVCHYRYRQGSVSHDALRMTTNCARALNGIMAHPDFPPDFLEDGKRGLAIRYVDGTKRLYMSGMWAEGRDALGKAIDLDPDLFAGQPSRIEDEIINAALDPLTAAPIKLLNDILDHLPENALSLQARRRQMLDRCHIELLDRGRRHRDLKLVGRHLVPAILAIPGMLMRRDSRAFIIRAIHGRLYDAKNRIVGAIKSRLG
ncbi:MAG: glycosyltransferase [Anaerolineae bacterium]|jgi:glycosyltransferase involved in cell wall biosynthesis